jgi:hypothetical protein
VTTRHEGFLIPRDQIGALQDVPPEELSGLNIWPDGSAIELESHDIHIGVNGLLTVVLPAMLLAGPRAGASAARPGPATLEVKRAPE